MINRHKLAPAPVWPLGLLIVIAATLRIRAAVNGLWLDEIWSVTLAGKISSPLQVFTAIHQENNQYLNSLWLYFCGPRGDWPGYRIPSIAAGVGAVILAQMIGARRNAGAGWFAMLLVAFSYVQILYSSEARGYSTAVFFAFLCFYAMEEYLEKPQWRYALIISIGSILGLASQLIFLNFFCAAILWSGWRLFKSGRFGEMAKTMLTCYAAPAAFLLALYFVDIRHTEIGGGTRSSLAGVYAESFEWALGAPPGRLALLFAFLFAVALCIAGIWTLWLEKSDSWIFFIGVILVFPLLFAIVRQTGVFYVRHFIIGMAFSLVLFGIVLSALYERGPQGRIICIAFLAGYIALNGYHTMALFKYGRGNDRAAVRFIAEHTKGRVVTIAADNDFRIPMILRFYAKEAMGDKTPEYYPRNSWPEGGPEWLITHRESFMEPVPRATQYTDKNGNSYDLVKIYPTAPLSGLHWFVYHNRAK